MLRCRKNSASAVLAPPRRAGENAVGYHKTKIRKGVLGTTSKLQEELDELVDAEEQGVKILIHCELADLYGALQAIAAHYDLTMNDLQKMSSLTAEAFQEGER
jgi:phosphoribosyl-ATP pyrophosphohydrolase